MILSIANFSRIKIWSSMLKKNV